LWKCYFSSRLNSFEGLVQFRASREWFLGLELGLGCYGCG